MRQRIEAERRELIAASFTAWQLSLYQGNKEKWEDYKKHLGLSDEKKMTSKEREEKAKQALSIAEKIVKSKVKINA